MKSHHQTPRPQHRRDRRLARRLAPRAVVLLTAAALLSAVTSPAAAQDKQFEITPYASYLMGGSFELFDSEFGWVEFDLEENVAHGVVLGFPITRHLLLELSYLSQTTDLEIDEGLFADDFTVAEVDIDTYLVGILAQGSFGQARPFFSAGIGVADTSLDVPGTDSEVLPALAIGGGVKTMFTRHVGLRFEGRLLAIVVDEGDDVHCCRRRYDDGETITQGQLTAGLVFAF